MGTFWLEALVAAVSAALGGAVVLFGKRWRHSFDSHPSVPAVSDTATPEPTLGYPSDRAGASPSDLARCEQAVCRAFRAVDTMSSVSARQASRMVVRRMEAELPNVRALVELGRSLKAEDSDPAAVRRVRGQLDEAAVRFGLLADDLVEAVRHHVEDPDLDRLKTEITALRARFPLLRPLSAVLEPRPDREPVPA